jgi:hypothetical protein
MDLERTLSRWKVNGTASFSWVLVLVYMSLTVVITVVEALENNEPIMIEILLH